ncbi:ribosome-inactivating family protein [Kitasatospora sp. NPDC001574]
MKPKPTTRRTVRPAAVVLTAALALTALGTRPAAPAVPPDKVTWVIHKLDDDPAHPGGAFGRDLYYSAVTQIRNWMAGPTVRGDVRLSQADIDGIIGIDIRNHASARLVTLFLNPHSGYLTGFHTRNQDVYYFSDANPDMVSEMKGYARSIGASTHRMHLSGSFDAWYDAATGGGLPAPTSIGTRSFRDMATSLGNSPGPEYIDRFLPQTAQYLLALSPAYAQAPHLTLFRDRVGDALANSTSSAVVLDNRTRELRSNWEKINNDALLNIPFLADDRTAGGAALPFPVHLGPVNGTLRTVSDVVSTLRILTNNQGREMR